MEEAVKAIKTRCKDKNIHVQIIALDLLDKCMRNHGIQLQLHVWMYARVCEWVCVCVRVHVHLLTDVHFWAYLNHTLHVVT